MFVGVPISVLMPNTFDAMTCGMMSARGLIPSARASCTLIGVISSMVVTLSSTAEVTAVTTIKIVRSSQ